MISAAPMTTRRQLLVRGLGCAAGLIVPAGFSPVFAQRNSQPFAQWVADFKTRAMARGVTAETFDRVMSVIKPDTSVYALESAQPEFNEDLWQYLNRRVSDWRITTGKERAREFAPLLTRIEKDYGVDRYLLLALWGMESAFGDVVLNPKHMRPVLPALAALAWGEPRRRAYWETELRNALIIVQRGWAKPEEMIGSWAGAMGHTQWMPEVWLNMGVDYDHDGRAFPYGPPDDALAGTAQYLLKRGNYRRGEAWGCEVRVPDGFKMALADRKTQRTYAQWQALSVTRADGGAFARPGDKVRLWRPVDGGPLFLFGQSLLALRSYNPSYNYALAIAHLGDRIKGLGPFRQGFPGGEERTPTLAEVQEIQRRLTTLGYDTDGVDGRVGRDTMVAIRGFQQKTGMPQDGYAGLKLLAALRRAS